jgi:Putative S-adenosyl-L-methionine-dependent methyltransferase
MSVGPVNAAADATTFASVNKVPETPPTSVPAPAAVLEKARRMGPLPYSELGPHVPPPAARDGQLTDWQIDEMDQQWLRCGEPDPYSVVEVGAGDGSRARELLALGPQCLEALRYVLVENDPAGRQAQRAVLPIEAPSLLLGPTKAAEAGEEDEDPTPVPGVGPLLTSLSDLPVLSGCASAFVIRWLSRLPSDRVEWRDGSWWEVRLAAGIDDETLVEILVALDPTRSGEMTALAGDGAADGDRFADLRIAVAWLGRAIRTAESGTLFVADTWTASTSPLQAAEIPPLALDQFVTVRRPTERVPTALPGGTAVVSWALG